METLDANKTQYGSCIGKLLPVPAALEELFKKIDAGSVPAMRKKVVAHGEGAILVVAGPGSGKTRVPTERVRRLLEEDTQHFRVLVLTFTNKAANEMVERLGDVPDIRQRAFVGTLHSFCM